MAVERSGQLVNQLGLKRENSGEPSMARRRTSFSIDEEEHPKITAERKQSIASELDARKNSLVIEEVIPEVAVETPSLEIEKQLGGNIQRTNTVSGGMGLTKALVRDATSNGHLNGGSKAETTEQPMEKSFSSKLAGRRPVLSTAPTSTASKLSSRTVKSQASAKSPTSPTDRPKEFAKQPENGSEKENKPAASHHSKLTPRTLPSGPSNAAPKTRIPPSPPQTGFVKPKPRSPTRPIRLPASLTAHTASSGSKTATTAPLVPSSRQSLSRASDILQATNPGQRSPATSRSPSRISASTVLNSSTRRPSILNKTHSRPSLGPPPSQLNRKQSGQTLPPANSDEGFLARMMRPTTSSASKTSEKTPPKRAQSVKHPGTRNGPSRLEGPKAIAPNMGKLVARPAVLESISATSTSTGRNEDSEAAQAKEAKSQTSEVPTSAKIHIPRIDVNESDHAEARTRATKQTGLGEIDGTAEQSKAASTNFPADLENSPDLISNQETPAPSKKPLFVTQEPGTEETSAVSTKPVVLSRGTEVAERNVGAEAFEEFLEKSPPASEPGDAKTVEIEMPKGLQGVKDLGDVRDPEEVAKMNADCPQASVEDAEID